MRRRIAKHPLFLALVLIAFVAGACASPTEPSVPDGAIRVTGTAQFFTFEGGFWAIRGDDGITYDPKDGLPAAYQHNGMRVSAIVKPTSLGGIHMAGPIVEILDIRAL
jgi:hypothetical protein